MIVNTNYFGLYLLFLYLLLKFTGDIRSSGMFHSVDLWLFGDVFGQPIFPVFRVQAAQREYRSLLQRR